jgi:DNA-binding ferritin-like protein
MTMKGISANPTVAALIMQLFHARTNAHVLHLRTRSFSVHKALNEFYDEIVGLTDSLAESYQGRYGIQDYPELPYKAESDPIQMIRGLRRYIDENREAMCDHSELQNSIDEIVALLNSTVYKLENLS